MPDITMCTNYKCPLRWECERSASSGTEPSERQSYSLFKPDPPDWKGVVRECANFMPKSTDR